MLLLDGLKYCAGRGARLSCDYFVPLAWLWNITPLEDENDDEHEDDFLAAEFGPKPHPLPFNPCTASPEVFT